MCIMNNDFIHYLFIYFNIVLMFQVKIQGQNGEMLKAACEQFLGKSSREVHQIALETLVSIL